MIYVGLAKMLVFLSHKYDRIHNMWFSEVLQQMELSVERKEIMVKKIQHLSMVLNIVQSYSKEDVINPACERLDSVIIPFATELLSRQERVEDFLLFGPFQLAENEEFGVMGYIQMRLCYPDW